MSILTREGYVSNVLNRNPLFKPWERYWELMTKYDQVRHWRYQGKVYRMLHERHAVYTYDRKLQHINFRYDIPNAPYQVTDVRPYYKIVCYKAYFPSYVMNMLIKKIQRFNNVTIKPYIMDEIQIQERKVWNKRRDKMNARKMSYVAPI